MKINRLKLVNFRNHSNTEFDFSKKITLIQGKNATGKTSVVEALLYLFTGKNTRTKKSGQGSNDLITFGESRAIISANVEGIGNITRTIPNSLQVADWNMKLTEAQNELYRKLGITEDQLICCINSNQFINMDASEQKEFILDLLGSKITYERVINELTKWAAENNLNIDRLQKYLNSSDFNGSYSSLDIIYKNYFNERKLLKRKISEIEGFLKSLPEKPEVDINLRDITLKNLKDLREMKDRLMIQFGKVSVLETERQRYEELIKSPPEKVDQTVDALKIMLNDVDKALDLVKQEKYKIKVEYEQKDKLVKRIEKYNGKCPLVPDMPCSAFEDLKKIVVSYKEQMSKINEKLETLNKNEAELKVKRQAILQKTSLREKYDRFNGEIKEIKKKLGSVSTYDIRKIQDELNNISKKVSEKELLLQKIDLEILNRKQEQKYKRDLENLAGKLKDYEALVKAFGPGGIKTIILNRSLSSFRKIVSQRMKLITNGKYDIDIRVNEKEFNIYVISDNRERKLKHLSSSEQLRVGVVFQDAISMMAKAGLLIVDNVDMLDKENLKYFWSAIQRIKKDYNNILLLNTTDHVPDIKAEDISLYILEEK